jgi:hypothetical protein
MAGASIGAALCVVRPGVQGVGGERQSLANQLSTPPARRATETFAVLSRSRWKAPITR